MFTIKSNQNRYDYLKSIERIDEILTTIDYSFEEADGIPPREKLTYSNGYYVMCSALFADIRGSSSLTDLHRRPKLAKLYRTFISEVVAVINGNSSCVEINIQGDCVSGIFNAKIKNQIDSVFESAAEIGSLIDIINYKFKKQNIEKIEVGIGLSYGRALMIQAGLKGTGINEILWMGDVVNEACKLGSMDILRDSKHEVKISEFFYNNLNDNYKGLMQRSGLLNPFYYGTIGETGMINWLKEKDSD